NTAPTTSEDFTIVAVNGSGDENPLYTVDPSSPSTTSIRFQPGQGQCRHIDGTTIDIDYTNTDGRTITVNTTYQLDESVTA
ncbi:hypothetical protein, partial [Herbaspirillum sp.]|uniref:hypothetical protein n=1 Tax=Herbaspirillum sp. TaxID=1890675 RepID=UPI002584D18B